MVGWEGDKGRGDIADLLGRFARHDPDKARNLQSELHKLTGERIPFRIAPTRTNTGGPMADLADGEADTVKLPKANPWGSAEHADRWEAGNMAKVLLGRTDYKDAVKHFAGEFKRNPAGAKSYTAAVYDDMAKASPKQAGLFARQMASAGLTERNRSERDEEPREQFAQAATGTMTDVQQPPSLQRSQGRGDGNQTAQVPSQPTPPAGQATAPATQKAPTRDTQKIQERIKAAEAKRERIRR